MSTTRIQDSPLARACGLLCAGLVALSSGVLAAPAPGGGDLDLSVLVIEPVQTIQSGSIPLTAGKSTLVRVAMGVSGTLPTGGVVDGLLRVYADGVETADSPIYSINGPIAPPSSPHPSKIEDTLNFVFLPPETSSLVLTVEVNPAGPDQLVESDYSNNTQSTPNIPSSCKGIPEVVFVPVDYTLGGGLPDFELIEPGVGDNFLQGVYPGPDAEYHRSDAPSKLWTNSLSGSGSSLNSALASDLNMMNPKPDFIYGWIRGSLPYNGQAQGIPGVSAMGNTQPIRHQRTFAHEVGHLTGLAHTGASVDEYGIDVEHHLAITQSLPVVKPPNLKTVMSPGLLTHEAWIHDDHYFHWLSHNAWKCTAPLTGGVPSGETLLVGGQWDRATGDFTLSHAVAFEGGEPTGISVPLDEADLVLRVWAGGVVSEVGLPLEEAMDSCAAPSEGSDTPQSSPIVGFVYVFPPALDPATVDQVEFVDGADGRVLHTLFRTPSAPQVAILTPESDSRLDGQVTVKWQGSDADGDELRYFLRYSSDGERFAPLSTNVTATEWTVDLSDLPMMESGKGFFEVIATDGLNTSVARCERLGPGPLTLASGGNPPWVYILTPDEGKVYPRAATVILHSSGWDLEDDAITAGDITWSSDLDGSIGVGRVTSTAALSVGTHVITVTATDSDSLVSTDTVTVTITDRPLPGGPGVVTCQEDLGFGGPGDSSLQLCGGDLSVGTSADLTLTGAAPGQPLWLVIGLVSTPTPLLGGTIVPIPVSAIVSDSISLNGTWSALDVPAGSVPATYYMQAVYLDPDEALGFGISNAIEAVFLP